MEGVSHATRTRFTNGSKEGQWGWRQRTQGIMLEMCLAGKRREHMACELFKSSNKTSCRLMVVYQCVCERGGERGVTGCYLCF